MFTLDKQLAKEARAFVYNLGTKEQQGEAERALIHTMLLFVEYASTNVGLRSNLTSIISWNSAKFPK